MATLARQGYDLIIGVGFAQGDAIATAARAVPEDEVRDHRRRPEVAEGQACERRRDALPRGAGRLPRRLPRGARRRSARRETRSARSAAFKEPPVDRFIAGYQAGAKAAMPGVEDAQRLLAGLGRPGEVQGARAQPDPGRREGRLPGRGRLRTRRARRDAGAEGLGDRRRRRPVVPRPARPHERAEARRRGASSGRSRACRTARGRAGATSSSASPRTASALGTISARRCRSPTVDDLEQVKQKIASGEIQVPRSLG